MEVVGFDVETTGDAEYFGLQPHRLREGRARVTSMALSDGRMTDAIAEAAANNRLCLARREIVPDSGELMEWPDEFGVAKVEPTLEDVGLMLDTLAGKWVVGWNTQFDIAWLIAMGLIDKVRRVKWLDGRLAWKHWRSSPLGTGLAPTVYGLKDAVVKFQPAFEGYDDGVDFDDMSPEAVARRVIYNKMDAWLTVNIFTELLGKLTEEQRRCLLLDSRAIVTAAIAMVEGIYLDRSAAEELQEHLTVEAETELVYLKIKTEERVDADTLRSPKKLRELLFADWGLKPVGWTDTGASSTDRASLMSMTEQDERCEHVWRSREAMANAKKFAENPLKVLDYTGNGRAYPNPSLYSTYTGRLTYATKLQRKQPIGVPLHQWKRGHEFRKIIKPPPGYKLMEIDWAGQEFRWMAVWSMDPAMLDMCAPGEDAHSFMASNIYRRDYRELVELVQAGDEEAGQQRKGGKVSNLSCIAEGQRVLTDRGYIPIEDVAVSDRVWDGVGFVTHDGVVYMGEKDVITHQQVTGTPDHKVLCDREWVALETAGDERTIQPALGEGWARRAGAGVRVVAGVVLRALREVRRSVREVSVQLRRGEGCEPTHDGGRQVYPMQGLRVPLDARTCGPSHSGYARQEVAGQASLCREGSVYEPLRPVVSQLWRTGYRVQVHIRETLRGVRAGARAIGQLRRAGCGQGGQRRSLRAGQHPAGDTCREPSKQAHVYDILNAGPRHRFTVEGRIVSNCQYRTGWKRLQHVARFQYGMPLTDIEAKSIHATYRVTYPRVPIYWEKQATLGGKQGFVETMAGRRVQVGYRSSWHRDHVWGRESTCLNFPVQGTGADQKYLGIAVLDNVLQDFDARFYMELHDGLFYIAPEDKAEKAAVTFGKMLSDLPYRRAWGKVFPVDFPVDVMMGPSWGDLQTVEID